MKTGVTRQLLQAAGGIALFTVSMAGMGSCDTGDGGGGGDTVRGGEAVEWVGYHGEVPMAPQDIGALVSGLVGADAQAGRLLPDRELLRGIFVRAEADPATPSQARLIFTLDEGEAPRRVLAVAPASFDLGRVYQATVAAALAKMQADNKDRPGQGSAFLLEYRVTSSQGGRLSVGVRGDGGRYSVVLDVTTPRTSLEKDRLGQAAERAAPYDTVAGTVWFQMTRDDFDFFVDRAYGAGATSRQNFTDFSLVPHEWLRLTIEPHLQDKFVNVGFEVLTLDGKRVALAKAPASILAGNVYQNLVSRSMGRMTEQEKARPGSSTPFSIPFYYDNPKGGGVVQVVAEGNKGAFSVAYAVESPRHPLTDVPFVAYRNVEIPPADPRATASCEQLGDPKIVAAPKGTLNITFVASKVVINSPDRMGPLQGDISCSVFHAKDVTVTGPMEGAVSLQDFAVPGADLLGTPPPGFVTEPLWAGDYQVLCGQDINGDGKINRGDPVTLPIGSYPVGCNINPVTVEFGILNPQG